MNNSLGIKKSPKDTKIVVAMSGGVDSSVVAGLMKKEGYNVTGITLKFKQRATPPNSKTSISILPNIPKHTKSKVSTLIHWRLQSLLWRNKNSQLFLALSLLPTLGLMITSYYQLPPILSILQSYLSGLFIAFSFAFQSSYDLRHCWLEKELGVSHQNYQRCYKLLGLFLGFCAGIINLISWSIAQAFLSISSISFETLTPIYIFFLALTPAWLLPRLFLQIDGRKTLVQVFAIILVSLFLNTGILATPFLLLGLLKKKKQFVLF